MKNLKTLKAFLNKHAPYSYAGLLLPVLSCFALITFQNDPIRLVVAFVMLFMIAISVPVGFALNKANEFLNDPKNKVVTDALADKFVEELQKRPVSRRIVGVMVIASKYLDLDGKNKTEQKDSGVGTHS